MGFRIGDETVAVEGIIKNQTEKAYLIELTAMGPDEVWLPKSQIVSQSPPGPKGEIEFIITEWIAKKNGLI